MKLYSVVNVSRVYTSKGGRKSLICHPDPRFAGDRYGVSESVVLPYRDDIQPGDVLKLTYNYINYYKDGYKTYCILDEVDKVDG